jgi:hypothetical protein
MPDHALRYGGFAHGVFANTEAFADKPPRVSLGGLLTLAEMLTGSYSLSGSDLSL